MEFNLEKFNPTVWELSTLSDQFKNLKIDWINDTKWYEIVKTAQFQLRDKRLYITKTLKDYRQEAISFQKAVIKQEKDLLWIIEETENKLITERKRVDELKQIEIRKKYLSERKEDCIKVWLDLSDDYLLSLSNDRFNNIVMIKKEENIEEEKRKIEIEKQKIEEEKQVIIRKKEIEEAKEEAKKEALIEAEYKIKKQYEENIQRINKQEEIKKAQEEKELKFAKIQNWLNENNYNPENMLVETNWKTKILYKQISTFTL